jgi:hypothetical protein
MGESRVEWLAKVGARHRAYHTTSYLGIEGLCWQCRRESDNDRETSRTRVGKARVNFPCKGRVNFA